MGNPSKATGKSKTSKYRDDVPWRSGGDVPRIGTVGILEKPNAPECQYALSIMKHPDPIGMGLAKEAILEPAGADCLIPGLVRPVKVLGLKVWPIDIGNPMKTLEPVGRELKTFGSVVDKALNLMTASFGQQR